MEILLSIQEEFMSKFSECPRCGEYGLERMRTHAFCVNCNYEEIYSDDLCVIPQWAIDAIKAVKPKTIVSELRPEERAYPVESAV